MKLAIGIDLHAKSTTVFASAIDLKHTTKLEDDFINEFNKKFQSFPSTIDGMEKLVNHLDGVEYTILIENSTKTHEIYWVLKNMGVNVVVAHSTDLFRITKSHKKTDKHDAKELSGYMRRYILGEEEFSVSYMAASKWMHRRELCRLLEDESIELGKLKRKIRSHLLLQGIQTEKKYQSIVTQEALKELRSYDDMVLNALTDRTIDSIRRLNNLTEARI